MQGDGEAQTDTVRFSLFGKRRNGYFLRFLREPKIVFFEKIREVSLVNLENPGGLRFLSFSEGEDIANDLAFNGSQAGFKAYPIKQHRLVFGKLSGGLFRDVIRTTFRLNDPGIFRHDAVSYKISQLPNVSGPIRIDNMLKDLLGESA